jgi:hypothetical protein
MIVQLPGMTEALDGIQDDDETDNSRTSLLAESYLNALKVSSPRIGARTL